jgi:glycosyltransferase involved in cell wall biosynthesis
MRPSFDYESWYGIRYRFRIVRLAAWNLSEKKIFEGCRYPAFDEAASRYALKKKADLVFTRSPYAGELCIQSGLNTIIEFHLGTEHPELVRILAVKNSSYFLGIVTITDESKRFYQRKGIPGDKIFVWPDAVDLDSFTNLESQEMLRHQLNLPLSVKIVTYCGHLYDHKGVPCVINAAKNNPDIFFCIVGGWPRDIERCQGFAKKTKNINFVGFIKNKQVPKYLAASDFLLLPNSMQHKEAYITSPLKLFEYMASRRSIIASDIPAFKGILRHRENAFLVEPDSPEAITSAINALSEDSGLSLRVAEQAWLDVQQFSWSNRAKSILKHFNIDR